VWFKLADDHILELFVGSILKGQLRLLQLTLEDGNDKEFPNIVSQTKPYTVGKQKTINTIQNTTKA
jgi:hypothetical protein